MQTLELPEITRPTREEYVTLLQDIALSVGVTTENISELLKLKRWTVAPALTHGKSSRVKLSIEKDFPIDLDSKEAGRVFELAGQSDRNKTTSLIYIATLLGINWEETRPFLDRDDKVYNVATRHLRPALSHGQKAELHLSSTSFELSIIVTDGRAIVSLLDEKRRALSDFDSRVIPLTLLEDWQQYRMLLESICDVQFVGKSRDFIGQVSIEESKDFVLLCNDVSSRAGHLIKYLQNLPKNQVHGLTEQERAMEVSSIKGRLAEVKKEIGELNRNIADLHNLIRDGEELIAIRRELEDDQSSTVQEVLKCLRLEEMARDQDKRKVDLEHIIPDLGRELERAQLHLKQQEPPFTLIKESLEALKVRFVGELKNLSALGSRASQIVRCIASKDYDPVLVFCNYALVNTDVVQLLDAILEGTKEFSKGLVIPLDSAEGWGTKLSDLEKKWVAARAIAVDVQRLNPELTAAYEGFQAANISSAQDLRRLESSVNTARALVMDKERLLRERQDELGLTNETLLTLLGAEDFKSLKARSDRLKQSLHREQIEKLGRVERLSHDIGYSYPWQLNPSDLQILIREGKAKIQGLEDIKAKKEEVELQLGELLFNTERSELRTSIGRPQPDALYELQHTLGLIVDYLEQYRRRREESQLYNASQLEQLKQDLGKSVDRVHLTLNQVIRQRCPNMYKNREVGPVKLHVQDYDFLSGQQTIPELQDGEWAGGGGDSAMTVVGLATRSSGSYIGTVLLVDEFNDAETFKQIVRNDLADLDQLAFAIFVKQDPGKRVPSIEVLK